MIKSLMLRKIVLLILLFLLLLIAQICCCEQDTYQSDKDSENIELSVNILITTMTDKNSSWDARCSAEDSLIKMQPEEVLPALLTHVEKGMPDGGIWNSGSRDIDKRAPVEWQIFYSVARSWDNQVKSLPKNSGGGLLIMLLNEVNTSYGHIRILSGLNRYWVSEAESIVAKIMENSNEDIVVRTTAAKALIQHGENDYHERFLAFAYSSNFKDQKRWFDVMTDVRHKRKTDIDPRVVQMGFDLILKERELLPNYKQAGYFLAITTGRYINQEFKPDQNEPQYQGQHGLVDKFFSDTMDNALAWWAINKKTIEKKLEPLPHNIK